MRKNIIARFKLTKLYFDATRNIVRFHSGEHAIETRVCPNFIVKQRNLGEIFPPLHFPMSFQEAKVLTLRSPSTAEESKLLEPTFPSSNLGP